MRRPGDALRRHSSGVAVVAHAKEPAVSWLERRWVGGTVAEVAAAVVRGGGAVLLVQPAALVAGAAVDSVESGLQFVVVLVER